MANGLFSFPISFDALGSADFDDDSDVDGRDFLVWQQVGGSEQNLEVWRQQFGTTTVITVVVRSRSSDILRVILG